MDLQSNHGTRTLWKINNISIYDESFMALTGYEKPLENFIDVDTTNKKVYDSLQEIREKLKV